MHIYTLCMKMSSLYLYISKKNLYYDEFQFFKIVFILANSANSDEMPPYAVFHASLYYLDLYGWGEVYDSFFILYIGSNSEDPDEMQHKVAFYQDLHCHLQGLKNIILYI